VGRAAQTLFVITWLGGKRLNDCPAPRSRVPVDENSSALQSGAAQQIVARERRERVSQDASLIHSCCYRAAA